MGVKFIDTIDDVTIDQEQKSWAGGADEFATPTMLPDNIGGKLVNCIVEDNGRPRTRPGADGLGGSALDAGDRVQIMAYFDTPTLEYLFASINASLRRWDGANWATPAGYPFGANTIVAMAQLDANLYLSDGVGQWFTFDGATYSAGLGTGTGATGDPPVGASMIVAHTNRLFASGTIGGVYDQVYASFIGTAGANEWNHTDFAFRVGRGEGQRITALAAGRHNILWVGKENSIFAVFAEPNTTLAATAAAWQIDRVANSVGVVGSKAMISAVDGVWCFGPDLALREIVPSDRQDSPFEVAPAVSEPAKPYIDRINRAALSKVVLHKYGRYLMLALPLDSATEPNTVLVWNLRLRRPSVVAGYTLPVFIGAWTGWTPTAMVTTLFGSGGEKFVIGDSAGFVNQWKDGSDQTDDDTYEDNSVAVLATIRSKSWDFGSQRNPKDAESAEVQFIDSTGTADVVIYYDRNEQFRWNLNLETVQNELPLDLPFDLAVLGPTISPKNLDGLATFREMFFQIEQKTVGRMELQSVAASAFINTQENE